MISNRMALLSMMAFVSNAAAHVVVLTAMVPITLSHTWPLHLLSMVLFLTMLFSLFSSTYLLGRAMSHRAQNTRGELHEYAQQIESQQLKQSVWQQMFGKTPVGVGIVCALMFIYAFGSFAVGGIQTPYSIQERDGELWFYDEYDGWVRRATQEDVERDQSLEIRFATAAFALLGFVSWAYFTYRTRGTRENLDDQ